MTPIDDDWPLVLGLEAAGNTIKGGFDLSPIDLDALRRHPLVGTAARKLQWAQGHLAAFARNVGQMITGPDEFVLLRADLDVESGYHVFRVESQPELSDWVDDFEDAIADVATNTRSALDKLAWKSSIEHAGGVRPTDVAGVKFPICDTETDWNNAGRARGLVVPAHCGLINMFQPYHTEEGNNLAADPFVDAWNGPYVHPLTLLRDFSNEDKHRDTTPVLLSPGFFSLRGMDIDTVPDEMFPGVERQAADQLNVGEPIQVGMEVLRLRLVGNPEPHIKSAGRFAPQVSLPEGRHATHTMERVHRRVHLILSEFARKFPAP